MKLLRILGVFIVLCAVFCGGCRRQYSGKIPPKAVNGVLDLSQWDFEQDGPVRLDGEWEFYWEQLLPPADFVEERPVGKTGFLALPKKWNDYAIQGKKLPADGYATFRLRVRNDSAFGIKAVRILDVRDAYTLWIDNKVVARAGQVGKRPEDMTPSALPQTGTFHTENSTIQLVLQVSHFRSLKGGVIRESIVLGNGKHLQDLWKKAFSADLFLLGGLVIMGMYHSILFLFRRKDTTPLFFAVLCFALVIRLSATGERLLLYYLNVPVSLNSKLAYIGFFLGGCSFINYLYKLFPQEISRKFVVGNNVISGTLGILTLASSGKIYARTLIPFEIALLCSLIYLCYAIAIAAFRKKESAILMLVGFIFAMCIIVNDILYDNHIVRTGYLSPFGLFIFMFFQSLILSARFSSAFSQVEVLSNTFEKTVEIRTRELKEAKEQAVAANRGKSAFLANMSHELRTPLTAILGYAQILSRSRTLSADDKAHLNTISRSGDHLLGLINTVLELSKIDADRIELQAVCFDLHQLLADLNAMFRLRTERKGVAFRIEYAADVPSSICADQGKLRQILINVLENALQHTEKGGVTLEVTKVTEVPKVTKITTVPDVEVMAHKSQISNLKFEITDTGIGIASTDLEKIFDAFVQVGTQQYTTGTGLGLPISRKYVRMMGGDIRVESEVEKGSTFTFEIPVDVVTQPASMMHHTSSPKRVIGIEPAQQSAGGQAAGGTPYRLLIVDDDDDTRSLMFHVLVPAGFHVREAHNGVEALELWKTWQPHLIWMDMRMPGMDGYEATREIRKLEAQNSELKSQISNQTSKIPIIALTASAFEEDRERVIEAGCDDFVRKPFRESEILDMLRSYLGVRLISEDHFSDGAYLEQSRRAQDKLPTEDREQKVDRLSVLTMDAFDALPSDVFARLQQAVKTIDLEMTYTVIDEIREYDRPLAEALTGVVKEFRFDMLRELLKETTDET